MIGRITWGEFKVTPASQGIATAGGFLPGPV